MNHTCLCLPSRSWYSLQGILIAVMYYQQEWQVVHCECRNVAVHTHCVKRVTALFSWVTCIVVCWSQLGVGQFSATSEMNKSSHKSDDRNGRCEYCIAVYWWKRIWCHQSVLFSLNMLHQLVLFYCEHVMPVNGIFTFKVLSHLVLF